MGETLRALRVAEVMCDWHRALITRTRLWPVGYIPGNHDPAGNNSCQSCARTGARTGRGRWEAFPGGVRRREAAIHEAGHAVVYLAHRVPVTYITLAPSAGNEAWSGGHINVDPDPERDGFAQLTGTWGGQSATMVWLRRSGTLDETTTIDAALTSADDCRQLIESGATRDMIAAARDAADAIVERDWPAVETIADALLAHGTIPGAELDLVIRDALAGCRGVR